VVNLFNSKEHLLELKPEFICHDPYQVWNIPTSHLRYRCFCHDDAAETQYTFKTQYWELRKSRNGSSADLSEQASLKASRRQHVTEHCG
jgi:hypothetical protein